MATPDPTPSAVPVPPPLEVVDPGGRRRRIHPAGPGDTVADLAVALGLDPFDVAVHGVRQPPHRRLLDVPELRVGAVVAAAGPATTAAAGHPVVEVAVTAGPACTPWRGLPPGRHLVGRDAACDLVVDDPLLERHVGVLEVDQGGATRFVQLAGPAAIRRDGAPIAAGTELGHGSSIEIGASRVEVRAPAAPARPPDEPVASDPWRRGVRRRAEIPAVATGPVVAPESPQIHRPPSPTPLIGGAVGLAGSLAVGLLLGNVLFAAFALLGAFASLATWGAGRIGAWRRTRRERARHTSGRDRFRRELGVARRRALDRHRRRHPPVTEALTAAGRDAPAVWQRTPDEQSGPVLVIGWGSVTLDLPVDGDPGPELELEVDVAATVSDEPVPLHLPAGSVAAVRGPATVVHGVLRGLLLQAATWHGPSRLGVTLAVGPGWEWAQWLPHLDRPGRLELRITDRLGGSDPVGAHQVVLLALPAEAAVPDGCRLLVDLGATGRGTVVGLDGAEAGVGRSVRVGAVSVHEAAAAAHRLAGLVEVDEDGDLELAVDVALGDLVGSVDPSSLARRWSRSDGAPRTPLGLTRGGVLSVDLEADGPHALVAGTTGSGKSAFLQSLVLGLASRVGPDDLNFVLADYKGGATFDVLARLPHVAGVLTDLDAGAARRALAGLDAEVRRREGILRQAAAADLAAYRRADPPPPPLPRLVVVVDEFAGLAADVPDVLGALVAIAQRGRSLGIHLVLATQRPAGVVSDDVRANTDLRVALRVNGVTEARDVVDDPAPAHFPRQCPGRLAVRRSGGELILGQAARVVGAAAAPARLTVDPPPTRVGDGARAVAEWVDAVVAAARQVGCAAPRRPFLDPLPHPLDPTAVDPGAVGLVDDPAAQCRHPLVWDPASGSLGLIGSVGAGLTSTVITVVAALCGVHQPSALELVVVDAGGDDRLDALGALAHCAGVIRPHETELLARAVTRLGDEIARRRARPGGRAGRVVLIVDGLSALRSSLSAPEFADLATSLEAVLRDGPAVGITALLADHGSTLCGATYPTTAKWVFEHCDENASALLPRRPSPVAPARPGRLWIAGGPHRGSEAQMVQGAPGLAGLPTRPDPRSVPPLATLPASVNRGSLVGRSAPGALALGRCARDLGVATLDTAPGENLLVVGGARRGVSTTLGTIADAWAEVYGPDRVTWWREGGIPEAPADGDRLVLVDDAHRIDADDTLRRLIADRRVTVCVGGRSEVLRSSYGHWARALAAAGRGIVLTGGGATDGELFGATLPRRQIVASRPGLAWIVDGRGERLVQIAVTTDDDGAVADQPGAAPVGSGGSSPSR